MNNSRPRALRVPARLDQLGRLLEFARGRLRQHGVGETTVADLHLAIDEACTNCINYAYPPRQPGEIELEILTPPQGIAVTVKDWGRPFNPLQVESPDLTLELEDRPIGGLGIYLMRQYADWIDYRREGDSNILTIGKHLARGGEDSPL